jgi:hypothetical protein
MKRILWALNTCAGLSIPAASLAYELKPGWIRDPAGVQLFQRAIYNPILDDYLLLYEDGRALVGHLSPSGVFSGETAISANIGVTHVAAAFNPEDGTFLVAYRDGEPPTVYGRYLTSNGTPIGQAFKIGDGGEPHVAFSPESGRYVVAWEQLSAGVVRYRVVDGESTSAAPNLTTVGTVGGGLSAGIAYGSGASKFLVVYIRDAGGSAKANVHGRFLSSNGLSLGSELTLAGGTENQQSPKVGYAPSTNRWMVVYENWADCGGGCPHVRGALVGSNGAVVKTFPVAATSGWDVASQVGYSPETDTFVTGWRSAFSDTNTPARAGQFSPVDGSPVGQTVLLSDKNADVQAVAVRTDDANPQAMFLWRINNGGDGLHAGIVNLKGEPPPPPKPDSTPPGKVTDLTASVAPGGPPLPATAIASTNPGPSATDMTKTTDSDLATYWTSPDRSTIVPEYITWDLGSAKKLSQVSLRSRNTGTLFPVDYQIQVSSDNASFTTVFSVTGASAAASTWVDHVLPEPSARYVKLLITKTKLAGTGKYKAQVAEVEILEATPGAGVALEWTAPGDDGNSGTAASYDLRWSSSAITTSNFGSATAIAAPAPKSAGTGEALSLLGFPRESLVHFALKSKDEAGNVSELSNVAQVATPGMAPAPVQGLTASNPTGSSVDLSWQPSGDDGNTGNAASYDLRYSTSPITDANFAAAASLIRPATNPKPALETYKLVGLLGQTTYYFAIKALDEVGNASLINAGGPVSATTSDSIAPGATSDLAVSGRAATRLGATAIGSSGDLSASESKAKAVDGIFTSYWSSPGRAVPQPEFITLDLGAVRSIRQVSLWSRPAGALFPQDLEIQVSSNNQTFIPVASALGLPDTKGVMHALEFSPVSARYVRVYVTKTRLSAGGLYYAQIAEIEIWEAITSYLLHLDWTEPGDDGAAGKAAQFDLRYSQAPIPDESHFQAAAAFDGEPAPQGAGASARFTFDPPDEGVTLYFRMKSFDDAGNASPLSNQASALVAIVPPAAVGDLRGLGADSTSVDLAWTATGDDGTSGTASLYDVRYSTSPITEDTFDSAAEADSEPAPAAAGTGQQMAVTGLLPSTTYYFAMKAADEAGAFSPLSNGITVTTEAPDTVSPAAITDLNGSPPFTVSRVTAPGIAASSVESASTTGPAKATDGVATSYWGSSGKASPAVEWVTLDTGSVREIGEVRMWSRPAGYLFPEDIEIQVSADNVVYTTAATAAGLPSTQGMEHVFNFPSASGRYVRVNATKTRKSAGNLYYAQIAEIQVYQASFVAGPITLNWTAPGDDGAIGKAVSYDLRFSTAPITDTASFAAASQVVGEPAPQAAGALESFAVDLPSGAYYFAIRARDEAGNDGDLSNVPRIVVP